MMRTPFRTSNRRAMHRVASLQIDSKGDVIDSGARPGNLKSLSMITGSTESLPRYKSHSSYFTSCQFYLNLTQLLMI